MKLIQRSNWPIRSLYAAHNHREFWIIVLYDLQGSRFNNAQTSSKCAILCLRQINHVLNNILCTDPVSVWSQDYVHWPIFTASNHHFLVMTLQMYHPMSGTIKLLLAQTLRALVCSSAQPSHTRSFRRNWCLSLKVDNSLTVSMNNHSASHVQDPTRREKWIRSAPRRSELHVSMKHKVLNSPRRTSLPSII